MFKHPFALRFVSTVVPSSETMMSVLRQIITSPISLVTLLVVVLLSFGSCEKPNEGFPPYLESPTPYDTDTTYKTRIMPFGASRVKGKSPTFESFRYDLWKLMVDSNWSIDYIGTVADKTKYPEYLGRTFDPDHEGHGGWSSGELLEQVDNWLSVAGPPDIVLFSSPGGNDALRKLPYNEALENVNATIDAIQAANPKVVILIEQLAPAREQAMTQELSSYLYRMQEDVLHICKEQSEATSKVIPVDMYTGFKESFYADDVHYNEMGAKFIAERYFEALSSFIE